MKKLFTHSTMKVAASLLLGCLVNNNANAQLIGGITTTYHGYWKSDTLVANPLNPDTSHTLLAFKISGHQYSTGVNDALLTSKGETFTPQDFRSLPMNLLTGDAESSTKIALGSMYDGVDNGAPASKPSNNMPLYLNDGIKGLNLGTGVANLPAGTLTFGIAGFNAPTIGDGIPDILITQIANPGGATDQYKFVRGNGTTVGNAVDISFDKIKAVGNWMADFYEASKSPMTLGAEFTKSPRPLRIWAADLSAFGITSANYGEIVNFNITLKGASDIAFIAYNNASIIIIPPVVLPVSLTNFKAVLAGKNSQLNWQTQTESNSKYFVVQTSTNGSTYATLDTIKAASNSSSIKSYSYLHNSPSAGIHYYRLQLIDADGKSTYSPIEKVVISQPGKAFSAIVNAVGNQIKVTHPAVINAGKIELYSVSGARLLSQKIISGTTRTTIATQAVSKGIYVLAFYNDAGEKETIKILL